MTEEIHEMHEHAEQVHHDPSLAPVSITLSVMAVLVAVVSLLGHRAHTEQLLLQTQATDTWGEYQGQSIKRHTYELVLELVSISDLKNSAEVEKAKEKYRGQVEAYVEKQEKSRTNAERLQEEVATQHRKANRFDLGEVCLEAGLVIASLTLLTKRRFYWGFGSVLGVTGLALAVTGFLVH